MDLKISVAAFFVGLLLGVVTCYEKDGKCYNPVSLAIAVDSSGSIEPYTWQLAVDIAKQTVQANAIKNSGNRFAVIDFNTSPYVKIPFDSDVAKVTAVLNELKENSKDGHSNIDFALEKAGEIFQAEAIKGRLGFFVIITDGYMTFRNGKPNQYYLKAPRDKLFNIGVVVFAVGVGKYVDQESLKFIASDPDSSHVFLSDDVSKLMTEMKKATETPCQSNQGSQYSNLKTISCGRVSIERIGCFRDKVVHPRPLPEMIFTDRDRSSSKYSGKTINWKQWQTYLPDLVCRCADATSKKGRKIFGLQFYGECWSNTSTDTYDKDGKAEKESNCKTFKYEACSEAAEYCVGEQHHNFVYRVTVAKD